MAGIGIILAWFGYSVFYYGLNTVTGGNDGFVSLIWPGRYTPTPRDAGGNPFTKANTLPKTPGINIEGQPNNLNKVSPTTPAGVPVPIGQSPTGPIYGV